MPLTFKQVLKEIAREKAPGPSPTFTIFHMLVAIELIAEKTVGRNKLAESLNVGEGSIRTIINRLKDVQLITISKAGCTLTKKGSNFWKEYTSIFKKIEVGKSELTEADYNFAVLIKNRGYRLRSGMEQRDAAVMVGAKNATAIVFKGGRLIIPSVSENVVKDFPRAANQIIKLLQPEEKDAIIIVGADSLQKAEYGTLAAAWTLLDDN